MESCQRQIGCHECVNFLLMLEKKCEEAREMIDKGSEEEKKQSFRAVEILISSFNRKG